MTGESPESAILVVKVTDGKTKLQFMLVYRSIEDYGQTGTSCPSTGTILYMTAKLKAQIRSMILSSGPPLLLSTDGSVFQDESDKYGSAEMQEPRASRCQ